MHVISKPPLVVFWTKHSDAKSPLEAWLRVISNKNYADFNELKATFGAADYVAPLTVFDIGGNKYRLIASIHYNRHKVYVRQVLTHAECDSGKWRKK
jgi:mRNA interferase HigB